MRLLEVENLSKAFATGRSLLGARRFVHAVNGIDFAIDAGETFALVGESGCGKSTTGRLLLGLETPSGGSIRYRGTPLAALSPEARRLYRRRVQVVFQDSNASLNPRKTLGRILGAALRVTRGAELERKAIPEVAAALLEDVGLSPAASFLGRYPHELSGGQRQRVGIARALAPEPELIIADEPVSALDISVRAQILTLLERLQRQRGLAYLFISHDLAVVRATAQRVGVMYLGKLVEVGPVEGVFTRGVHPYTQVLIDATPQPRPGGRPERLVISGDVPSPQDLPPGCAFHTRCPLVIERCRSEPPPLRPLLPEHLIACHRAEERLAGLPLAGLPPSPDAPRPAAAPTADDDSEREA